MQPLTPTPSSASGPDQESGPTSLTAAGIASFGQTPGISAGTLAMLARLQNPVWIFDIDHSRVRWANAAALDVWRATSIDELMGRDMGADMSEAVARRLRQYQADFERSDALFSELWTLYPRGIPRTLKVIFSGIRLEDRRMAMLCEAIGEQHADPDTLRSVEALLHTSVMITLYDDQGRALYRNPAARSEVANAMGDLRQHFVDPADADMLRDQMRRNGSSLHVCRVHTSSGERWHRIAARRNLDAVTGKEAWLVSEVDISDLKQIEAQANFLAHHDSLTGLPNRHFVNDAFHDRLERIAPDGKAAILMFIDLDNFKQINDSLGHASGDQLLRIMAARLLKATDGNDLVARLGGDEFLIFTTAEDEETSIRSVGERLLESLSQPVQLAHHELSITASMGVARFPRDGNDLGTLMRQADLAMYGAKNAGRNRLAFFSDSMLAQAQDRLSLEIELRHAIERREFSLHYQPRFSVADGHITGAEALVRWNHPQRGLIMPDEFIAICEETGLIVALGGQVLEMACKQLADWQKRGILASVAVNLSPRQFGDTALLATLSRIVETSACDPHGLELEITESMLLGNDQATRAMIQGLRDLGCSVTVDDFGTGYSNLAYLHHLPLTSLKIDRSFISSDHPSRPLAEMIITLGHSLGLNVVAEGVETEEQLAWLRQAGCDEYQGFLRTAPCPPDEFERLATASRGKA